MPLFPLLFFVFTVIEELAQSLSPNRTFDIGDLVASSFGIMIGYFLAEKLKPIS
ncbi:VanZ family protein [Pseudanabaena sp. UWO311]|uniref:VanZ family protein n=1 Tax=Pseudanabaena sp. UWO311 TaxID=2487337 RepID=UPI00403FBDF4